MTPKTMYAAFAVKLLLLTIISHLGWADPQQCMNFNSSFLSNTCGYDHTVRFRNDKHFNQSVKAVHFTSKDFSNCSEYSNLILCSNYVPRCKEDLYGPYLPCKPVCDEFANDCRDQLIEKSMEWLEGQCQLLPEFDDPKTNKGYLGRCFKPPGFKPSSGGTDPIKCSKVVVPLCQGLGYDKTFVSEAGQRKREKWLPDVIGNYTNECGQLKRKFMCTDFIQPCKDGKLQMLCRHQCEKFFETCNGSSSTYLDKTWCLEFPEGNPPSELCPVGRDWPRLQNWPKPITSISPTEVPSAAAAASKRQTLEVFIAVVVSLFRLY